MREERGVRLLLQHQGQKKGGGRRRKGAAA